MKSKKYVVIGGSTGKTGCCGEAAEINRKARMDAFILSRHKGQVRKAVRRRVLEKQKAGKHQIELVLAHLRNVYQAEALAQIQRHVARSGAPVPGFDRMENILQQKETGENGSLPPFLEVRGDKLYVCAVNEPLEHIAAEFRFVLDETPVNPDSPLLETYTANNGVPLSRVRALWGV